MVVVVVAVVVATGKYKTCSLYINIHVIQCNGQSKHLNFNRNHSLYPIQISMNVKIRTVAVITNV